MTVSELNMERSDVELVGALRDFAVLISHTGPDDHKTAVALKDAANAIEELTRHVFNGVATIERLSKDNERLKEFARKVIEGVCWDFNALDGGDVQELAEKLGLIVPATATAEDIEKFDLECCDVGDTFYKFTPELAEGIAV